MRSIRLLAATTIILFGAGACGDDGPGNGPSNVAPTAAFTVPTTCVANSPCLFTDQSTDTDGTVTGWSWVFSDAPTVPATDRNPSHTFAAAGEYTVTLTVTDDDGTNSTPVSHTVVIGGGTPGGVAPTAAFTVPTCIVGVPCTFTSTSTDDVDVVSADWDFGEPGLPNNTQSGETVNYTYNTPGTFTVTLTVTDNEGLFDDVAQQVAVTPSAGQDCATAGTLVNCTLTLTQRSTVTVTLTTNDCELGGNRVDINLPLAARQVLFFNGCSEIEGTQYVVDDAAGAPIVFEAGTQLVVQFRQGTGIPAPGAPAARVTGTGPWTINIDDGGNPGGAGEPDFGDLVLTVATTAAP